MQSHVLINCKLQKSHKLSWPELRSFQFKASNRESSNWNFAIHRVSVTHLASTGRNACFSQNWIKIPDQRRGFFSDNSPFEAVLIFSPFHVHSTNFVYVPIDSVRVQLDRAVLLAKLNLENAVIIKFWVFITANPFGLHCLAACVGPWWSTSIRLLRPSVKRQKQSCNWKTVY